MKIGYARISTVEQNLNLQTDALEKAGCEKIFTARGERLDQCPERADRRRLVFVAAASRSSSGNRTGSAEA